MSITDSRRALSPAQDPQTHPAPHVYTQARPFQQADIMQEMIEIDVKQLDEYLREQISSACYQMRGARGVWVVPPNRDAKDEPLDLYVMLDYGQVVVSDKGQTLKSLGIGPGIGDRTEMQELDIRDLAEKRNVEITKGTVRVICHDLSEIVAAIDRVQQVCTWLVVQWRP